MFEKNFLEAVAERAVKTFLQTYLALIGTNAAGVLTVDYLASAKVAGSAALLSVLTSFASSKIGNDGPSLSGESTTSASVLAEQTAKIVALQALANIEKSTPKPPTKTATPKVVKNPEPAAKPVETAKKPAKPKKTPPAKN